MISQNTPNKLNRRKWLRDAAVATTSAAVLPSLLTGCMDHRVDPGSGLVGALPLGSAPTYTDAEYEMAYNNLIHMRKFSVALHARNKDTIGYIYKDLKGDPKTHPTNFIEIAIDVISEICVLVLEVAAEGIPGVGPFIGAGIGIAALGLKAWSDEETERAKNSPNGLNTTIGTFEKNYDNIQDAIVRKLDEVSFPGEDKDPSKKYKYLREKWTDVEFNGKNYSLRELMYSNFPNNDVGSVTAVQFDDLVKAANKSFEKYFWNAIIVQCGKLQVSKPWAFFGISITKEQGGPVGYAQDVIYKTEDQYPTYTTVWYEAANLVQDVKWYFVNWYFTFDDGVPMSKAVADILFIDDTPGNIINKDGLWPRDYVFKQFHREKPIIYYGDDGPGHPTPRDPNYDDPRELGRERVAHENPRDDVGKYVYDYEFTGGLIKSLTKPK